MYRTVPAQFYYGLRRSRKHVLAQSIRLVSHPGASDWRGGRDLFSAGPAAMPHEHPDGTCTGFCTLPVGARAFVGSSRAMMLCEAVGARRIYLSTRMCEGGSGSALSKMQVLQRQILEKRNARRAKVGARAGGPRGGDGGAGREGGEGLKVAGEARVAEGVAVAKRGRGHEALGGGGISGKTPARERVSAVSSPSVVASVESAAPAVAMEKRMPAGTAVLDFGARAQMGVLSGQRGKIAGLGPQASSASSRFLTSSAAPALAPSVSLIRGDGSLPKIAPPGLVVALVGEDRLEIPTLEGLTSPRRISELVRESGTLPRVTSLASERAAQAVQESYAVMKKADVSPDRSSARSPILDSLNEPQHLAVVADPGYPCMVLAGPGSGKTRVLVHRAAYLVREIGVSPSRIIAVTFTNKAAGEMKERINILLDEDMHNTGSASDMLAGTFHAVCTKLLRQHGLAINIPANFDIADSSDVKAVVVEIAKKNLGAEYTPEFATQLVKRISAMKNDGGDDMQTKLPNVEYARLCEFKKLYDERMRAMNKLDFDDLLVETRRMLNESKTVLHLMQTRYHHILVDEWQDTNTVQYEIVSMLAAAHRNLFVVGDADQSIYKFRGADSRNMGRFASDFPDAETVALVQNYRSTRSIVEAAQSVIGKNRNRPEKMMMTANDLGAKIELTTTRDQADEVYDVVRRVRGLLSSRSVAGYSDIAVLYRTNAQSRPFEEACVKCGIPYRLVGGTRFYERQEVKDLLAYLCVLRNPLDDTSLLRAINTPPRGIGPKAVETLQLYAQSMNVSLVQAIDLLFGEEKRADETGSPLKGGPKKKIAAFFDLLKTLRKIAADSEGCNFQTLFGELLKKTDFKTYTAKIGGVVAGEAKAGERWKNVEELISSATMHKSLNSFMENVALVSDVKDVDEDGLVHRPEALSLMTLHGGKGLEFPAVFMPGLEEGLMPMIFQEDRDDEARKFEAVEEERRLAYVGMTRARNFLFLSWRKRRLMMRKGQAPFYSDTLPSRFLKDVPAEFVTEVNTVASYEHVDAKDSNEGKTVWKSGSGRKKSSRSGSATVFKSAQQTKNAGKRTVTKYD